ncbi:MAG: VOC family protein [Chloroflexi bacterium]|nr:VOC family protein [Chloroflexota bacterium]
MTTHTHAKPAGTPTWIDLLSPDTDVARKFYAALFGWEFDASSGEYGGYVNARLAKRAVAGLIGNEPGAAPAPAAWNLYFASDNAQTDAARAVELGAQVVVPAMAVGPLGSMATLVDPTGAGFGFWQAGLHVGSQVTDEPGATAWCELYASDAKQARDFYAALLHATVDPMPGGMEYYVLKHGDMSLCGIMQIDPSWGNFKSQWITYFTVANTDEAVAIATRQGGKAMGTTDDSPFGRLAALADPGGAAFKVIQPPAH